MYCGYRSLTATCPRSMPDHRGRTAFVYLFIAMDKLPLFGLNSALKLKIIIFSLITLFLQFIRFPTAHRFNEDTKMVSSAEPIYNNITSPFDKPWDLSHKADQERWLVASKAASDNVCFDISVATAETFLELLKDKSKFFRWGPLMSVPINGTGAYDDKSDKLANGGKLLFLRSVLDPLVVA
jgi:hypothetical protein